MLRLFIEKDFESLFTLHIYIHIIKSLNLSLSLSLCLSLSIIAGPLDYSLCPYRAVVGMLFLVDQHWHVHVKGVYRRTLLIILSLLLLQCPACLVRLFLDGFRDRGLVAVQLLFRGMLLPGFVQYIYMYIYNKVSLPTQPSHSLLILDFLHQTRVKT